MKVCTCAGDDSGDERKDLSNRLQYRVSEVAELLGVSVSMVKVWVRTKALESYTMGKMRFVDRRDLQRFVDRHRADGVFDTAA